MRATSSCVVDCGRGSGCGGGCAASARGRQAHRRARPPQVRVNQVGYPASGPKAAYAMLPRKVASVRFEVVTPYGVAYRGTSTDDVGRVELRTTRRCTSSASPGCACPGSTRSSSLSPAPGRLPRVHHRGRLRSCTGSWWTTPFGTSPLSGTGRTSFPRSWTAQPANLTDEKAYVYADPRYDSNDNLLGTLKKTGGPVDVSGGWFDAGGGYEKFAYTASYADALMLLAARALSNKQGPNSYDMLAAGGGVRPAVDHQAVGSGAQGALRPGRHRHRQRQQHDPGRLQLLVPAPAGGPDERQARREPGARAPTTSSTGRCSRPLRPVRRSAPTWRAGSPPTSPSAPSWPRAPTRRRRRTC